MRPIEGSGTPETTWRAWAAPTGWPRLDLTQCPRAVVVAPHPDDEVLGAGGVIATLARAGVPVTVVAVTDGEASHPASRVTNRLAERRTAESLAALADLGLQPPDRLRLHVPDGEVTDSVDTVSKALCAVLAPGDWCFATWRGDGHPDHEATGQAAHQASHRQGARLLEYPIWMWHWARPDDPEVPWHQAFAVDLPVETAARKATAITRFVSQLEPIGPGDENAAILPPYVLERFHRSWETVFA